MNIVVDAVLLVIGVYLLFNSIYFLVFAIGSLLYKEDAYEYDKTSLKAKYKFAVFIPCYQGDEVIKHTFRKVIEQTYPRDFFELYVIADTLRKDTIEIIREGGGKVIEVCFENRTKVKALRYAVDQVGEYYDYAIILDIDNVVERDFLSKVNHFLLSNTDVKILQVHRVALNLDSSISVLDAISEEVNNNIFRAGHRALGLSAALIGSGIVMDYDLYRDVMGKLEAVGGFDKEMELFFLKSGYLIEYLKDVPVYDEKVSSLENFDNQRRRWLSAQFFYFRRGLSEILKPQSKERSLEYINKVVQMALLPRLLHLGSIVIFSIISIVYSSIFVQVFFILILLITVVFVLVSIPRKFYNLTTLTSIAYLPVLFFIMIKNIVFSRGTNRSFVHTKHEPSLFHDKRGSSS